MFVESAEEGRTDGPAQKRDAKGGHRGECGRNWIGGREEQFGKNEHGGRCVDIEVEELDGGADHAGEQHLARGVDVHVVQGVNPVQRGFLLEQPCLRGERAEISPDHSIAIEWVAPGVVLLDGA